jgi:hypothetical protein
MVLVLPIDTLNDYISNTIYININDNIEYNKKEKVLVLSVYNIVVGSYMCKEDILNPSVEYKRNHECPQVVKNIFHNLESQVSSEMLEYISHYDKIIVRQYLILVDDIYNKENSYYGLCSVFPNIIKDGKCILEYNIQYNEYKSSKVFSCIEPVIVPSTASLCDIHDIIKHLSDSASRIPIVVNIMDCTSNLLRNLFINNDNSIIYLSKPNCLLCDDNLEYMPMITFDINNQIRWVNYNLDNGSIPNLLEVKDVCSKSESKFNFLRTLYKVNSVNITLLTIYKMLGMLSITKIYTLQSGKTFTFNDLTFHSLIKLWSEPDFHNLYIYNFDTYYEPNIRYYMNSLVHNNAILADVKNNTLLKDILLEEAKKIINKLNEYFPKNPIILKDNNLITIRDKIRNYIEENGTYL